MKKFTVKIDVTVDIEAIDERAAKEGAMSRVGTALERVNLPFVDLVFADSYPAS